MTDESISKDRFFAELSKVVNSMIEAHGKDFTMGTLVLAARFIAEGKSHPINRWTRPEPDVNTVFQNLNIHQGRLHNA